MINEENLLKLRALRKTTQVYFDVYDENKQPLIKEKTRFDLSALEIGSEMVVSEALNSVFIVVTHKKTIYILRLDGTSKEVCNCAILLQKLVENKFNREVQMSKSESLLAILTGEMTKNEAQRVMQKYNYSGLPCFVLMIRFGSVDKKDLINLIESYSTNKTDTVLEYDNNNLILIKFVDNQSDVEYQSSTEYASILCRSISEEMGIAVKIGIGSTVRELTDGRNSFVQACEALKRAIEFNAKGQIHSYKDFVLIKMLDDFSASKLQEYYDVLINDEAKQIFDDEDMVNTAEEFMLNDLNVSETSRNLYMHRNTLTYRLDKIEKATGLNIKNFSEAVTFKLITIIKKLLNV